jgi:hypothetical protein
VQTWFICTSDDGCCAQARFPMKPRVGVYLSEAMAARLAEAAKRPGATKSALVEAALERFLGSDDDVGDPSSVGRHLAGLSHQIEQLDRHLRVANETVALHARFHLAVTPLLPVAAQGAACALGAQRFEEFAAQVGRRVDQGISLIGEAIGRGDAARAGTAGPDRDDDPTGAGSAVYVHSVPASNLVDQADLHLAAVREDGSNGGFPGGRGSAVH